MKANDPDLGPMVVKMVVESRPAQPAERAARGLEREFQCVSAQKPVSLQGGDAGARPDPTSPTGSTEVGAVPLLAVPG